MSSKPEFPYSHISITASISNNRIKKQRLSNSLENLAVIDWLDFEKLVKVHLDQKAPPQQAATSRKNWVQAFKKVFHADLKKPYLSTFAYEVAEYLESDEGIEVYDEAFNLENKNRNLKRRTDAVSRNTRKMMKLGEAKILNKEVAEEFDSIDIASSLNDSAATGDTQVPSSRKFLIKKQLYDEAAELHVKYANSEYLSPVQTKRMSLGLSGILDFIDDGQATIFKKQDYDRLKKVYTKKFGIRFNHENPIGWLEVAKKCESNGMKNARRYLDSLCADESLTDKIYQTYKFYDCILNLIQNTQHILNPSIDSKKITEADYTCHIWVPIFKHLFSINENESCIRLKVGDSALDDSTDEKAKVYDDSKNMIGFKIDIRCLHDHKDEEIDVCSMEVCLPDVKEEKILGDLSKLLREGRTITSGLLALHIKENTHSWIIQISGLQAFFSTVTYADVDLFVAVNQFHVEFPTCISELLSFGTSIQKLIKFKDDVESICESIKPSFNYVKRNTKLINRYYKSSRKVSSESSPHIEPPSTSNWYTPPDENRFCSVIPRINASIYSKSCETQVEDFE